MSSPVQPPLRVETVDGTTSGRPITTIKVTNGDLTISGSTATIDTSGAGGGGTIGGTSTTNQISFGDTTSNEITSSGNLQFLSGQNLYVAGRIQIGNATGTKLTTVSSQDLILDTNEGTNSGNITIEAGTNGQISITPDGTGIVKIDGVGINNSAIATGYILKATSATEAGWVAESSSIGGTIAENQIAVGSSTADEIEGSASLTYSTSIMTIKNQIELSDVGSAGILKNSQGNQDLRLQVAGTGNVRIENQTTDTASQLNVKGNGTGTPQISLSNDSKAITIKCDENQKLKIAGGSSSFIFDASSGTGGITWPDGTTQITAASASTNNFDVAPRTQGASVWGSFTRFDVSKDIAFGSGFARNFNDIDQDKVYCWPFIGSNTGNVSEMGIYANTSGTYTVYAGIYSDNAGQPDTLLGYATFSVTGANIYYQTSFSTTISMVRGVQYWYAFKHEHTTSVSFRCMDQTYQNAIQTVSSANQSNQVQYYTYSSSALESDLSSVTWIPQASIGRFILTLKW